MGVIDGVYKQKPIQPQDSKRTGTSGACSCLSRNVSLGCLPRSAVLEVSKKVNEISKNLNLIDKLSHTLFCGVEAYTVALY